MPLKSADFRVTGGSFYAHVFENPSAGIRRDLFWSATVEFSPIEYLGEYWLSALTIEWLPLAASRFSGEFPASPKLFPCGESSLYLAFHQTIDDWRCAWTWDGTSTDCHFEYDVTLDLVGLDSAVVSKMHLKGATKLAFDGFVVVPDNLSPRPSSVNDAAALLTPFFDAQLIGTDEGWRYTFRPNMDVRA